MTAAPPPSPRGGKRRFSIIGLIGELLITAGVLVFLFLGWQLWLNDLIVGAQQDKAAVQLAKEWSGSVPTRTRPTTVAPPDYGTPVVPAVQSNATKFAVLYIPRFGADYARAIAEGVGTSDVLDKGILGHYPDSQLPGAIGNFAVAGHRTTHGAPLKQIASLRVGDKIYVQTADGYFTYDFRGLEYVRPTGVGVIDPVPQNPGVAPTDRIMTMTSCNPMFSSSERIVGYAVFDSWQPTSAGPPAEIAATVKARG
ncbi:MAG TPA: class E sortase [Lacisediminihabitans sp.]|jgi:sortase A|nr:class E sortase [Lacisediminihabitans sp.]HXD62406.1 class E sortase [Lacisediminihabitans sp.]